MYISASQLVFCDADISDPSEKNRAFILELESKLGIIRIEPSTGTAKISSHFFETMDFEIIFQTMNKYSIPCMAATPDNAKGVNAHIGNKIRRDKNIFLFLQIGP